MPRTNDPFVQKIDLALESVTDSIVREPLVSIRRQLLHWPEHDESLSIATLHQMAGERLRQIPGNPAGA